MDAHDDRMANQFPQHFGYIQDSWIPDRLLAKSFPLVLLYLSAHRLEPTIFLQLSYHTPESKTRKHKILYSAYLVGLYVPPCSPHTDTASSKVSHARRQRTETHIHGPRLVVPDI